MPSPKRSTRPSGRSTGADGTSVLIPLLAAAVAAGFVAVTRAVRRDREVGVRRTGSGRRADTGRERISAEKVPQDADTAQIPVLSPAQASAQAPTESASPQPKSEARGAGQVLSGQVAVRPTVDDDGR